MRSDRPRVSAAHWRKPRQGISQAAPRYDGRRSRLHAYHRIAWLSAHRCRADVCGTTARGRRSTETVSARSLSCVGNVHRNRSYVLPAVVSRRCLTAKEKDRNVKIHEYQGKEIFRRYGMTVPRGVPAFSVDE